MENKNPPFKGKPLKYFWQNKKTILNEKNLCIITSCLRMYVILLCAGNVSGIVVSDVEKVPVPGVSFILKENQKELLQQILTEILKFKRYSKMRVF
ncbi:hypothetical protein ACFFWB_27260 [Flavobacterium procerum]|uniref:hypothetical protein n=1 Tax=Flavobacterium procerum TaxID=1455569 RepID=UPI0035EB746F